MKSSLLTPQSPQTTASQIIVTEYRLRLSRPILPHEAPRLRGYFGRRFSDAVLMHHHRQDGSLVYEYPKVQFKVIEQQPLLLGLDEGGDLLEQIWLSVDEARLARESLAVLESNIFRSENPLGETGEPLAYRFLSPWLALNQKNASRYHSLRTRREKRQLLERILTGNCLSIAKAFGHTVDQWLQADCSRLQPIQTTLKGTPMQGFTGEFRVNFQIPELAGIGKSVSRGFGAVSRAHIPDNGGNLP